MNIYLDIDGVLLIDEKHAAPFADEFLQAVLNRFPDSTYWLTTHNWRGENRTKSVLVPYLTPETVETLKAVKPTEWGELKTDAIDFSQDFLWFDDDLWPEELKVLEAHEAAENFMMVDLEKDPEMLKKLTEAIKAHS